MSAGIGDLRDVHTVMHIRMCIRQNRIQCTYIECSVLQSAAAIGTKVLWTRTFSTALSCTAIPAMICISELHT